jgi:hypothetical protein
LREISAEYGKKIHNVNLEMAKALPDNLEILFDKNLKPYPLPLARGFARNFTILASWNGTFADNKRGLWSVARHPAPALGFGRFKRRQRSLQGKDCGWTGL